MVFIPVTQTLAQKTNHHFSWSKLPSVPGNIGYAGSFSGVSNGTLLVAGGANFPDGGTPWSGSKKKWHDEIFALESPLGQWKAVGKLPRALGYGVSISWNGGLICIGGSNEVGHYADVFIIKYEADKVHIDILPALPKPLANSCGTAIGDVIYIAGGTEEPNSQASESVFWSLDLSKTAAERKWQKLTTWPGPSRMLSVAGSQKGAFYLFSGANLDNGKRTYLKDAYKYVPHQGWSRLADLPQSAVAAPSPAYAFDDASLLIFGGDDGKDAPNASELKEKHPGFSKMIFKYNVLSDGWSATGQVFTEKNADAEINPNGSTWAPVTTPLVIWNGKVILPGGEIRPAIRTPNVLMGTPIDID